jgi:transglutaminase superfamily protein
VGPALAHGLRKEADVKSILPLLAILVASTPSARAATGPGSARTYDLRWHVQVDSIPPGVREAKIWIALPQERAEQHVTRLRIESKQRHAMVEDAVFRNRVAMFTMKNPPTVLGFDLAATVRREPVSARGARITEKERKLYLRREALVSLSPRIHALADSVGGTPHDRYEFVLKRMDYDKTVPGWGRGDSERACDVGKGNCTDFHSLFLSLSRAEGVPAVFEMGYSMLPEGETNHAGGYHCWAWFYDDATSAWVPVDISEADRHPEKAEFFFGHLDADRVLFSRGRDVLLPGMKGAPLNYLPSGAYVELDGVPVDRGVTRTITYAAHEPAAGRAAAGAGTSSGPGAAGP